MSTFMKTKIALVAAVIVGSASVSMAASDYYTQSEQAREHHYATGNDYAPAAREFGSAYSSMAAATGNSLAPAAPQIWFSRPFTAEKNQFDRASRWGW